MQETGKVIKDNGEFIKVLIVRRTACGDCGACQAGKKNLNMVLDIENTIDANLGDEVLLELNNENFLLASLILYGIPLIALIFGILLGYYSMIRFGYADKMAQFSGFILGIAFTFISYIIIKRNERKIMKMDNFKPRLIEISDKGSNGNSDN